MSAKVKLKNLWSFHIQPHHGGNEVLLDQHLMLVTSLRLRHQQHNISITI